MLFLIISGCISLICRYITETSCQSWTSYCEKTHCVFVLLGKLFIEWGEHLWCEWRRSQSTHTSQSGRCWSQATGATSSCGSSSSCTKTVPSWQCKSNSYWSLEPTYPAAANTYTTQIETSGQFIFSFSDVPRSRSGVLFLCVCYEQICESWLLVLPAMSRVTYSIT